MIGAIIGDVVGSRFEFRNYLSKEFELLAPNCEFTDDTVMTCAVAEWLMEGPNHTHEKLIQIMHRYGEEYPHAGYGGMFKKWLENKWKEPYNSFGNGSAMRVSPVGYYAKSLEEALQLAEISAEVTHNHPEGIIGAKAVAATIFLLKNNEWLEKGKKFLKEYCFYDLDKIKEDWDDIRHFYTFDVTCQGSVPEAIYCGTSHSLYEDSIREAVSLGGDADTQAAIAGGIAAVYNEVPEHILNPCLDLLDPPLIDVIDHFNKVCNQNI